MGDYVLAADVRCDDMNGCRAAPLHRLALALLCRAEPALIALVGRSGACEALDVLAAVAQAVIPEDIDAMLRLEWPVARYRIALSNLVGETCGVALQNICFGGLLVETLVNADDMSTD